MTISVTAPIEVALKRTGKVLFQPFDITKWFKLGFCAFLVQIGDCSGGSGGGSWDSSNLGGRNFRQNLERAGDWLGENLAMVLAVGLIVFVLIAAIWITLLWLQGRGRFMFLDGVVRDRGAVVDPWHEYRSEGNSLFRFAVTVSFLGLVLALTSIALGLLLAWNDIQRDRFEGSAILGVVLGGGLLVVTSLFFLLLQMFLNDFVVPAMYKRRIGVMEAWRVVLAEVLRPHLGVVVFYVLIKLAIAILSSLIALTLMCGTLGLLCCFMAIPYIGTVLLLPLTVFNRSFSLSFLRQLGATWHMELEQHVPAVATE